MLDSPPDAIIITVSAGMWETNGYKHWLTNFLFAMNQDDWTYHFRAGGKPKHDIAWVYLCIGGRIRYRANFVTAAGPGEKEFSDGRKMYAKAWITIAGPVQRSPYKIERKGFQGFRYTQKIF